MKAAQVFSGCTTPVTGEEAQLCPVVKVQEEKVNQGGSPGGWGSGTSRFKDAELVALEMPDILSII